MNAQVTEFINKAPSEQKQILERIRQLLHESVPGAAEEFKWSRPGLATTEEDKSVVGKQGAQYPFWSSVPMRLKKPMNATQLKTSKVWVNPQNNPWGTTATFKDLYGNVLLLKGR